MGTKLRSRDQRIMGLIEHRAGEPLSTFAGKLKVKEGTLRYYVQSLIDRGVITGCVPGIDFCLLGYTNYTILFKLAATTQAVREELYQALCGSSRTAWAGKFSGPYELGAVVLARGPEDLADIFERATGRFQQSIHEKNISIKTEFINFGHRFLNEEEPVKEFGYRATGKRVSVDATDLNILSAMLSQRTIALRQIERITGTPFSTVRRRVAQLEKSGVIKGFRYQYNLSLCGVRQYSLLLRKSSATTELGDQLLEYCRSNPLINGYIRTFGSWDFELLFSAPEGVNIQGQVDKIFEKFGAEFQQAALLEIFEEGKISRAADREDAASAISLAA